MRRKLAGILVLGVLLIVPMAASSCAPRPTTHDADKPKPTAEWPMRGHDARHTGRAPSLGPKTARVLWTCPTGKKRPWWSPDSSPVIGRDGTVYVGSCDGHLSAISPSGTVLWSFPTTRAAGSPSIGPDGTIYVGTSAESWSHLWPFSYVPSYGKLFAVRPDGTKKWEATATGTPYLSPPTVGADGTVYVVAQNGRSRTWVYAFNPDGTTRWRVKTAPNRGAPPALGADGTVYVGTAKDLIALTKDGAEKWTLEGDYWGDVAVGDDGTVYVNGDHSLRAVSPTGTKVWEHRIDVYKGGFVSQPVIGPDGTIYVGNDSKALYAVNPDGTEKWRFATGERVVAAPAIGADGTIYVCCLDGRVYAIGPDGHSIWQLNLESTLTASPALGKNGVLYFSRRYSELLAVGPIGE